MIKKRGKRDYYIEVVLFFILGILLGIAVKTEAVKRVTMGYSDYKMKIMSQDFDINKMQRDMLAKQIETVNEENPEAQNNNDNDQSDPENSENAGEQNNQ